MIGIIRAESWREGGTGEKVVLANQYDFAYNTVLNQAHKIENLRNLLRQLSTCPWCSGCKEDIEKELKEG